MSVYDSNQVYIAIAGKFFASESEMKKFITFAEHGNDVFISAWYFSAAADAIFKCSSSSYDLSMFADDGMEEKMVITLNDPPFGPNKKFAYPGKKLSSYFNTIDSTITDTLGFDETGRPNFIHLRAGKGNFYLHMEPLAFSNYFLLHQNNIRYFEKAMSVIPANVNRILWDEYYLGKNYDSSAARKKKTWLGVLFTFPAMKAALLTAIFTLLLYVVLEMRRKQRPIPVISRPRNETLEFVKTIGRLYYDKGDHKNLVRKMSAYFLEHVRNRYKMATNNLDDHFVKNLQFKSGLEESEIRGIVGFIKYIDDAPAISHDQLTNFHKQLETFYWKT